MDFIQQQNRSVSFQNDIPAQIDLVNTTLRPILEKSRGEIESISRDTVRYGPGPRHEADIFWPPGVEFSMAPLLVFVYGGGFRSGARVFPPPHDLTYRNVGAFFAKQGYVTVIPDYRLLPDMKWPDPVTDVRDALVYVVENFPGRIDTSNIFILGHSAGGAITADIVLIRGLLPENVRACVRGIAPFGAILHHSDVQPRAVEIFTEYYAGEDYRTCCASGLLESASDDFVRALPDVLLIVSEFDVPGLMNIADAFMGQLQERGGKVEKYVAAQHNHASPLFGLFMGEGEDWAYHLDRWFKARISKASI